MPEFGTLWIGGTLSWMEQLCLKSFVDAGQPITLFHYHDIANVPEGVILRDGREVINTEEFLKHRLKNSYALFADKFRLHMIKHNPGMIWVDTDVYFHRPLQFDSPYVMGFEKEGGRRVNNAILGLPAESALLDDMIAFTDELYPEPAFMFGNWRQRIAEAKANGRPLHVSQMPWGTWGPLMLSYFVRKHDLLNKVQPIDAFYPITFPERRKFLRPKHIVDKYLTENSSLVHYWASNKVSVGTGYAGFPPPRSWFMQALEKHGIRPELAPITKRGHQLYSPILAKYCDLNRVTRFTDIGGGGQGLALTLFAQTGCAIDLVDIDKYGRFQETESPWVKEYRSYLAAYGIDKEAINRISKRQEMRASEVVTMLGSFSLSANYPSIVPMVERRLLAPGSRFMIETRPGALEEDATLYALDMNVIGNGKLDEQDLQQLIHIKQ